MQIALIKALIFKMRSKIKLKNIAKGITLSLALAGLGYTLAKLPEIRNYAEERKNKISYFQPLEDEIIEEKQTTNIEQKNEIERILKQNQMGVYDI